MKEGQEKIVMLGWEDKTILQKMQNIWQESVSFLNLFGLSLQIEKYALSEQQENLNKNKNLT
uniref:Uncharacterized protein n=1 Tax=Prevotella sp. GTC17254 TaxID=3236794 RepID=A0AB33J3A3_9BACT